MNPLKISLYFDMWRCGNGDVFIWVKDFLDGWKHLTNKTWSIYYIDNNIILNEYYQISKQWFDCLFRVLRHISNISAMYGGALIEVSDIRLAQRKPFLNDGVYTSLLWPIMFLCQHCRLLLNCSVVVIVYIFFLNGNCLGLNWVCILF